MGDNCTAGALQHLVKDAFPPEFGYKMVFFRTTDGGKSWQLQDPKLPFQCCVNQNHFRHIQQIDSLNIVAVGDTGLILRSVNGGTEWLRQSSNTLNNLTAVHFSDSLHGIITSSADTVGGGEILTTNDGGITWRLVKPRFDVLGMGFTDAHCYGENKYAVMTQAYGGPIYTTSDNWGHIKQISVVNGEDSTLYYWYNGFHMRALDDDTILIFGAYWGPRDSFPVTQNGVIRRSVSGGTRWDEPHILPEGKVGEFNPMWSMPYVTDLQHDTIIASGEPGFSSYYISTDRGSSWQWDTISTVDLYDSQEYLPISCRGLQWTKNKPIGIFAVAPAQVADSYILSGRQLNSSVLDSRNGLISYNHRIYPNPAKNLMNIASGEDPTSYHITDVFGRIVQSGMVGDHVDISVDISALSAGVYFVFVDDLRTGNPVLVGKAVVAGK